MTKDDAPEDGRESPVVEFLSGRDLPRGRSALGEIEAHWRDLWTRAGGHLPRRADLDASRIAGALPHAFILEKAAPGVARLRIAGRALTAILGTEPRGLPLTVLFGAASRTELAGWLERCFATPALVELPVETAQGPFRPALTGRLLLLPMLDQDGDITRALGGLFLDGVPRRTPLRLELPGRGGRCEPLRRPADESGPVYGQRVAAAGGLRESERPYLRLVVSNPKG